MAYRWEWSYTLNNARKNFSIFHSFGVFLHAGTNLFFPGLLPIFIDFGAVSRLVAVLPQKSSLGCATSMLLPICITISNFPISESKFFKFLQNHIKLHQQSHGGSNLGCKAWYQLSLNKKEYHPPPELAKTWKSNLSHTFFHFSGRSRILGARFALVKITSVIGVRTTGRYQIIYSQYYQPFLNW